MCLNSLANNQWVEHFLPFNKPVDASRNAPKHKLATSAPRLYCSTIHGRNSLFSFIAVFKSPLNGGTITRSDFFASLNNKSGWIENAPPLNLTSFVSPTNCTLNNGGLPAFFKNSFIAVNMYLG